MINGLCRGGRIDPEFVTPCLCPFAERNSRLRPNIPSAVNIPLSGILHAHGRFRSETELRPMFSPFDAINSEVVTYCTIGGRASTAWFALTYPIGRVNVRVYDGSWAGWGLLPSTAGIGGIPAPPVRPC